MSASMADLDESALDRQILELAARERRIAEASGEWPPVVTEGLGLNELRQKLQDAEKARQTAEAEAMQLKADLQDNEATTRDLQNQLDASYQNRLQIKDASISKSKAISCHNKDLALIRRSIEQAEFSQGRCVLPLVPPEIFSLILQQLGPTPVCITEKARDRHVCRATFGALIALSLVSKRVRELVVPSIYRRLLLDDSTGRKGKPKSETLVETFRRKPDLAALVRKIEFDGTVAYASDPELIRLCPNCEELATHHPGWAFYGSPKPSKIESLRIYGSVSLPSVVETLRLPQLDTLTFKLDPEDPTCPFDPMVQDVLVKSSLGYLCVEGIGCPIQCANFMGGFGRCDTLVLLEGDSPSRRPPTSPIQPCRIAKSETHAIIFGDLADFHVVPLAFMEQNPGFLRSVEEVHIFRTTDPRPRHRHIAKGLKLPGSLFKALPPNVYFFAYWCGTSLHDVSQVQALYESVIANAENLASTGRKVTRIETLLEPGSARDPKRPTAMDAFRSNCERLGIVLKALDQSPSAVHGPRSGRFSHDFDLTTLEFEWPRNGIKIFFDDPPVPRPVPRHEEAPRNDMANDPTSAPTSAPGAALETPV